MIRHPAAPPAAPAAALSAALLALSALWLPLPFGSVTPWAVALAEGALFTAAALALLADREGRALRRGAPALALAGIAALGFLQALPLPAAFVALVSPGHSQLATLAEEAAGAPVVHTLSLAPGVSRSVALWWLAVAAAFVAAVAAGRDRRLRRWLAAALVAAALFQAVYALQAWWVGVEAIWGLPVPRQPGRLRGTFVNPAHMAALLEVAMAVVFAAAWVAARRAREEPAYERRLLWLAPPVALWVFLFATLTFTASRAALLAALVAVAFQGLLVARAPEGSRRRSRHGSRSRLRTAAAALLLAGVGLAAAAGLAFDRGLVRLASFSTAEVSVTARAGAYAACWELWQRFPVLGTGLGTFRAAFPLVQPASLGGEWWHAHSDLLEVPVTVGLLGAGLLAWGLLRLVQRLRRVLQGGRRTEDRAAALAALGACAGFAVHEAVDFPLTMPAVAVALAVLCGLACGVSLSPPEPLPPPEPAPAERPPQG